MSQEPADEELLAELERLAAELGRRPTKAAMYGQGEYDPAQYVARYGSWDEALDAVELDVGEGGLRAAVEAEFDAETIQNVEDLVAANDEAEFVKGQLLAELMRLTVDLQESPTIKEMNRFGKFWSGYYNSQFGSWSEALAALNLEPKQERALSRQELLDELERVATEVNGAPSVAEMRAHGKYSVQTYYNRFDSWPGALAAAGLAPEPDSESDEAPDSA